MSRYTVVIVETGENYAKTVDEVVDCAASLAEAIEYAVATGYTPISVEPEWQAEFDDNGEETVINVYVRPETVA